MKDIIKNRIGKIRLIVFSVVGYSLIFVLLASAIFVFISNSMGKDPFIGNYSVMWVKTGSMEPLIPEHSYILVKKAEAESVELNDVIVFVSDDPEIEGQKNVHRVVGISESESGGLQFVTRGDNPETNRKNDDYPASGEKLVGKYVKTLSFLSVMGRVLSNTVGIFLLVVMIISILLVVYLPEISKIVKKAEEIKNEKDRTIEELVRLEVERLRQNGIDPSSDGKDHDGTPDPGSVKEDAEDKDKSETEDAD